MYILYKNFMTMYSLETYIQNSSDYYSIQCIFKWFTHKLLYDI